LSGGYHCAQPLFCAFCIEGAASASLAPYSLDAEIDEAVAFAEAGTWEPVEELCRFVYASSAVPTGQ